MARKPRARKPKPQPSGGGTAAAVGAAAAGTIGGVAAGTSAASAAAAAAAAAPPLLDVAKGTAASAAISGAFAAFLADKAARDRAFLGELVLPKLDSPDDVKRLTDEEVGREEEFNRRARERVDADLIPIMALPDQDKRDEALQRMLNRERRFVQMRTEAMALRATRAVERFGLRRQSPLGAFWLLDPAVDNCPRCSVMASKFWPWAVLDRVFPPLHPNCACWLVSLGEALESGWMSMDDVLPVEKAVRMASGIVLESDVADKIIEEFREYEAELEKRGISAIRESQNANRTLEVVRG